MKPKYGEKAKLCYMHADTFVVYIKTDDTYKDITQDVEIRFDTSNQQLERPILKEENKKVIHFIKAELGG